MSANTTPENYQGLATGKRTKLYTQTTELTGADAINPSVTIPPFTTDGAADTELITISDIDFRETFPETRTNIGEEHFWTHVSPDISCPFVAEGDTEAEKFFFNRASVNPVSRELRVFYWHFRTTGQDGTHTEFTFRAKLTHMEVHKSRGEQGEFVTVFGMLRVLDMVPRVTRQDSFRLKTATISGRELTLTFSRGLNAADAIVPGNYAHPGITLRSSNPIRYTAGAEATDDSTVVLTSDSTISADVYAITVRATLRDADGNRLGADDTRNIRVT